VIEIDCLSRLCIERSLKKSSGEFNENGVECPTANSGSSFPLNCTQYLLGAV
jgi:hypothetical protein